MLRVALTGGIGTGKSHVVGLLRQRAVPTLDADQIVRALQQPGQPVHAALLRRFGPGVFGDRGVLDRKRLGAMVFGDAAARGDLEAIVHPPVRRAIDDWFDRCRAGTAARFAVADIPLLFETGRAGVFDRVVVVACEPASQLARIMARDGLPAADARRRIAAQLPIADKADRTDLVVATDGSFEETERQVEAVCRALGARA